jgi:hypothetical protein
LSFFFSELACFHNPRWKFVAVCPSICIHIQTAVGYADTATTFAHKCSAFPLCLWVLFGFPIFVQE